MLACLTIRCTWTDDRYMVAIALGRQHFPPFIDELFVWFAHRSDVAVEIMQTQWIYIVVVFPGHCPSRPGQSGEYRKPDNRNAIIAHPITFAHSFHNQFTASLPEGPLHQVGFGVHYGDAVAVVVLQWWHYSRRSRPGVLPSAETLCSLVT